MNQIISVGVTDSPGAQKALDWAVARAAARHDRVRLVSVMGDSTDTAGEAALIRHAQERTQYLLDVAAVRARKAQVEVATVVERGDPVRRLLDISDQSDLLVIGSDFAGTGSSGIRGPRGIRIAAAARCPVVVVPDASTAGRSGVVVGVDGSVSSERAIAFAAAEADRFSEPLTAVLTWAPIPLPFEMDTYPDDYLAHMQAQADEVLSIALAGLAQQYPDLSVRRIVRAGFPAEAIVEAAARARLAVVGSHGRGAIGRFLLGSTSQTLIERLPTVTAVIR